MSENKLNKNFVLGCGVTLAGMGLIGYACHVTKSAKPLWALLAIPVVKFNEGKAESSSVGAKTVGNVAKTAENQEK